MIELEELLDYLAEHPTSATILAAVHDVKTKSRRSLKWRDTDLNRLESEMSALPQLMDQLPSPIDEDLRASMDYANKLMADMKKAN